jgi:hypothetical protein
MFAELGAIDAPPRMDWTVGAIAIVVSGIAMRAATVPAYILFGMLAALGFMVLFALGSRSEVEAFLMDDDVFLRFAWLSGVLFIGLGLLAITWIYNHTDTKPRHRH